MTEDSTGVCWVEGGGGFAETVCGGKEGVRQIANSAEERKTVAEGGFIHYISDLRRSVYAFSYPKHSHNTIVHTLPLYEKHT